LKKRDIRACLGRGGKIHQGGKAKKKIFERSSKKGIIVRSRNEEDRKASRGAKKRKKKQRAGACVTKVGKDLAPSLEKGYLKQDGRCINQKRTSQPDSNARRVFQRGSCWRKKKKVT